MKTRAFILTRTVALAVFAVTGCGGGTSNGSHDMAAQAPPVDLGAPSCAGSNCRRIAPFTGSKAAVSDQNGKASIAASGRVVLDHLGLPLELSLVAAPAALAAGSSGLITVRFDPGGAAQGGLQGSALQVSFPVQVSDDRVTAKNGLTRGSRFCVHGKSPGAPCKTVKDCSDGTCDLEGTCFCTSDEEQAPFVGCTASVKGALQGDDTIPATLQIACAGPVSFVTLEIPMILLLDIANAPETDGGCPDRCDLKKLCLQPIQFAAADGSMPTMCPSFQKAIDLWKKCCVAIDVQPAKVVKDPKYKSIDTDENTGMRTQAERDLIQQQTDDDGANACLEVYCLDTWSTNNVKDKDLNGGAKTFNKGAASAKIAVVGDAAGGVVAHEVGHALGLDHPDTNGADKDTAMKPTAKHDVEAPQVVHSGQCHTASAAPLAKADMPPSPCCKMPDP